MSVNGSHDASRVTRRSPVHGGTSICSRCDQPRAKGVNYCAEHRNEVQRTWRAKASRELKQLREIAALHNATPLEKFPEA